MIRNVPVTLVSTIRNYSAEFKMPTSRQRNVNWSDDIGWVSTKQFNDRAAESAAQDQTAHMYSLILLLIRLKTNARKRTVRFA